MRGFLAFCGVTALVAWLLLWPGAWPFVVTALLVAFWLVPDPRNRGGNRNGGSGL